MVNPPVTIAQLKESDAPEIEQIMLSHHRLARVPIGPEWSSAQIRDECRGRGWTLRDERGELLAFILLRDAVAAWEITFLATAISAQRHGYMRKLFSYLVSSLECGKALWLEVHELNDAARQMYQGLGFKEVGRRPKYYADGGGAVLYNFEPQN